MKPTTVEQAAAMLTEGSHGLWALGEAEALIAQPATGGAARRRLDRLLAERVAAMGIAEIVRICDDAVESAHWLMQNETRKDEYGEWWMVFNHLGETVAIAHYLERIRAPQRIADLDFAVAELAEIVARSQDPHIQREMSRANALLRDRLLAARPAGQGQSPAG